MSDHDAPHPVDKAYVEAEAQLDDDAARRARRARVLGAVAREPVDETIALSRPRKAAGWRYVGWLTAACVAGLGGLMAYQLSPTAGLPPVASPGTVSSEPAPHSAGTPPPPALDAEAPLTVSPQLRRAPQLEERAPETAQSTASSMAPPAPVAPPPVVAPEAAAAPPPAAFPASQERSDSLEARGATPPVAPMAAQAPAARVQAAPAAPPGLGSRLRAAAAAGRIAEVNDLLAQGAPVDARDSDGETALMKSVRANRAETAALLRRRGADPDLENRAGVSAREMAEAAGNPALVRAVALDR